MADPDELFFGRAMGRMMRWMLVLAGVGFLAGWAVAGWRWGVGFLLGAGASALNFRWLKQLVEALGASAHPQRRPKARIAVFMGLRYALLGLGTYAILATSVLRVTAVLCGLFVAVAAVIVEILFELVYARN